MPAAPFQSSLVLRSAARATLRFGNVFARSILVAGLLAAVLLVAVQSAAAADDEAGFVPIFDGKTLEGWDGDPKLWSVKDDALVGEATAENMPKDDTFCVWRKGTVDDFVLRMQIKISGKGPNSGVQYRSKEFEKVARRWLPGRLG